MSNDPDYEATQRERRAERDAAKRAAKAPAPLLPCPSCAGPATDILNHKRGWIGCVICDLGTAYNLGYQSDALEVWNRRVPAVPSAAPPPPQEEQDAATLGLLADAKRIADRFEDVAKIITENAALRADLARVTASLDDHASVLLKVRRALCGDIHNQDHIVEMAERIVRERDQALAHLAAVRAMLRIECAAAGCNDWPNNLHLADVIEKHLARKLCADLDAALAAMRRVLVGAENQGAFTGMSWREAEEILRAAIEAAS
jgi:hypothetical protein